MFQKNHEDENKKVVNPNNDDGVDMYMLYHIKGARDKTLSDFRQVIDKNDASSCHKFTDDKKTHLQCVLSSTLFLLIKNLIKVAKMSKVTKFTSLVP